MSRKALDVRMGAAGVFVLLVCAALFLFAQPAFAVTAFPGAQVLSQPDGAAVSYHVHGDELFHYTTAENGALVQKDPADDVWKYVIERNGAMALANRADEPSIEGVPFAVENLLTSESKAAYYALGGAEYAPVVSKPGDPVTLERLAEVQGRTRTFSAGSDQVTMPLITIVVGFSDQPYQDGYDWSSNIFSGEYSTSAYWDEMSEGAFTFVPAAETSKAGVGGNTNTADAENDGVIHVSLDRPHGCWGSIDMEDVVDWLGTLALALEKAGDFIDFSSYDANGDGAIGTDELGLLFVIGGYETSVDGIEGTPSVWAHKWEMLPECSVDGVALSSYIAIGERANFGTFTLPGSISTVSHELGHYLGLPDLYNIAYNAFDEWADYDAGYLTLMATGSWGKDSEGVGPDTRFIATGLDPFSRMVLGYIDPEVITENGTYAVGSETGASGYRAYIVPTTVENEFFIVENRQYEGFDRGLIGGYRNVGISESLANPTGGIVVWHIDAGIWDRYWPDAAASGDLGSVNRVNTADHRPGVMPAYYEDAEFEGGIPLTNNPFYNEAFTAYFPDAKVETRLYGGDMRADRIASGIVIDASSPAGDVMEFDITLPSSIGSVEADTAEVAAAGGVVGLAVAGAYLPDRLEAHVFEVVDGTEVRVTDPWGTVVPDAAGVEGSISVFSHAWAVIPVLDRSFSQRTFSVALPENTAASPRTYRVKMTFDRGAVYTGGVTTVTQAAAEQPLPGPGSGGSDAGGSNPQDLPPSQALASVGDGPGFVVLVFCAAVALAVGAGSLRQRRRNLRAGASEDDCRG